MVSFYLVVSLEMKMRRPISVRHRPQGSVKLNVMNVCFEREHWLNGKERAVDGDNHAANIVFFLLNHSQFHP